MSRFLPSLWPALILCWCSAPGAALYAQTADPARAVCPSSAPIADLLEEGRRLAALEQNTAAKPCFELAVSRAVAAGDRAAESESRLALAQAAYQVDDYPLATTEGTRARELANALGNTLQAARATGLLGSVAIAQGERAAARSYYETAIAMFAALGPAADRDRASALINMVFALRSDDPDGLRALSDGLALARTLSATALEARALHLRADRYFSAGRFDDAVADLSLSIEKFQQADKPASLADAYVSLGRLYRAHGQPEKAIEFYDRAAEIQERIGELRGLVQSVNAKAIALGLLGRTAESRTAYERALALARQSASERLINFVQGNLAAAVAESGDRAEAIRLLEDVVTRETDSYMLGFRYGNLARYYSDIGQHQKALEDADKSIEHGLRATNRDYLVTLYYTRASINRALGRFDRALDDAREGIKVIEEIRARLVPLDFMKRGFSDLNQSIFNLTIALANQRGDPEQALLVSEQARARAFLDLLASRDGAEVEGPAPQAAGPASAALAPGTSSQPPAAAGGSDTRRGGIGPPPAVPLRDLALASDAFASTSTAAEIAATATRLRTAVLAYWVSDDDVHVWVVRPGQPVHGVRIAIARAALERAVLAALPRPDASDTAALRRLYTLLVTPVVGWLPPPGSALTIVPHGPLFRVSFAALMDTRGRYLIERYAIGYGPSATAFAFTDRLARRARARSARASLIVADPSPLPIASKQDPLPALTAAIGEASAIRNVLGRQTTVLSRTQAGETAVRQALRDKRVVHFATHGVIRDDDPFDSYLALGVSDTEAAGDGRLTVRELYDLTLSSELVVLSACRTATGRASGDGIAGMARALFYAGTPTVVATLWDIADQPSAFLMKSFYSHWIAGADKRAALRSAQLDLLRELRSGSMIVRTKDGNVHLDARPFYWAGYVLIGEPF